jgi:hypothetical protein
MKLTIVATINRTLALLGRAFFCVISLLACKADQVASEQPTKFSSPNPSRPDGLSVVADDLGMLNIGTFASEIRLPTIDGLAKAGASFNSFFTSATCSPIRSMLRSGSDSYMVGSGNITEHMARNQRRKQGYDGYLSSNVVSIMQSSMVWFCQRRNNGKLVAC